MAKESQNVNLSCVVMNRGDEPVTITADIKHGRRIAALHNHRIGMYEHLPHINEVAPIGSLGMVHPPQKGFCCVWVFPCVRLDPCRLNYSHTLHYVWLCLVCQAGKKPPNTLPFVLQPVLP